MSVFIVPASFDGPMSAADRKRRPRTPKKSVQRNDSRTSSSGVEVGHNFLMKAGNRAYQHQIDQMKAAAASDLRSTNDALATELVRCRATAEERSARERVEVESKARQDMELQQQHRMKEIQKRFREEHSGRSAAETECVQLRQMREMLELKTTSLEAECVLHRESVAELRSNSSRLEATVAAHAAVVAELRSRLTSADSKLETEQAARLDAQTRLRAVEVQLAVAQERNDELSKNLSEAESKRRSASSRVTLLQDDVSSLANQLSMEKESSGHVREGAAKLQKELTQLQAASALAATASVADKSELERLHRELHESHKHCDSLSSTLSEVREAKSMLITEAATMELTVERLQAELVTS
eukprot:gene29222-5726_t